MRSDDSKKRLNDIFGVSRCPTFDLIAAYVEDKLSEPERFAVEKHLLECKLCSEAVEGLVKSPRLDKIRRRVSLLNQKDYQPYTSVSRKKRTRSFVYYAMAAVVVLGIIASIFVINRDHSHDALFAEYFKSFPNNISIVRGSEESNTLLLQAMMAYDDEDYQEARRLLQELLVAEPENVPAHFYVGNILLISNQPVMAISHFQKVIQQQDAKYLEPAEWYLGLAYLKAKELERAKSIFAQIKAKDSLFQEQSAALLERLQQ